MKYTKEIRTRNEKSVIDLILIEKGEKKKAEKRCKGVKRKRDP